jgi:hypothetical protein
VITVKGAWEVSWELSQIGKTQASPRYLYPDANETHNGVTLAVKEVMLSDRMTRVELALPGLPPGAELVSTSTRRVEDEVYLEDESGRRLVPLQDFISRQETGFDPAELRFASQPAQSKALALYIPAVEIFYPGEASLAVDVPQDVQFHQETEKVTETITQNRWVSDPWPVDLSLEIAGYWLHFDRARLERRTGRMEGMYLYRLELTGDAPTTMSGEAQVSRLRVARIARPDGQTQSFAGDTYRSGGLNPPYSRVGPRAPGSAEWIALLSIDVTTLDGLGLSTARYTIDLNGVVVSVPGPWRLRWALEE